MTHVFRYAAARRRYWLLPVILALAVFVRRAP